jgi:hypothetical protein
MSYRQTDGTLQSLMVILVLKRPDTFVQVKLELANAGDELATNPMDVGTEKERVMTAPTRTRRIRTSLFAT